MILRARIVAPLSSPPIENGAVAVDGNAIVAVGRPEDLADMSYGPEVDLGDVVLMPGLINAHCHLDYTMMRHAISPPKSFTAWVQRINALKRSLDNLDYLSAIKRGFQQLVRWGTTSVCNIEAFPELMPNMPEPPIRTWWFYEMIDIRHRITTDDVVAGALSFFHSRPDSFSRFGLSPHAPYTASRPLFELANACANTMTMLLTTHVAESEEESAMFRSGEGPLYEFMQSLGRPMHDCGKGGAFELLWKSGAINGGWILAHMNDLREDDFALLANAPKGTTPHVVHCPGSHRYFDHPPFHFRRLQNLGVNICVGTDSLASTNSLSLFDEMRRVQQTESWLSAEQVLHTVTLNPAKALQREGRLGRIAPGALADMIALPVQGSIETIYDEIVAYRDPVPWMMINGKQIPT